MMKKIISIAAVVAILANTTVFAEFKGNASYSDDYKNVYIEGRLPSTSDVASVLITDKDTGDIKYAGEFECDENNYYYAKFRFNGDISNCELTVREGSRDATNGVEIATASTDSVTYTHIITDEGGSTKLTPGEVAQLVIKATNKYAESTYFTTVIAYYTEKGELISCDNLGKTYMGYEASKEFELASKITIPQNAMTIKAFVWESMETAIPLSISNETKVKKTNELPEIPETNLASTITMISQSVGTGHVQGIAIDRENGFIYASISNALVKSDMNGNVVGSIYNLPGHIGDIAFNPDDGRVYAAQYVYNGNGYISMIDGDDIAQVGMEYSEHKEILKSVYAVSADGTAIGPGFGETDSDKMYLYITKNKGVYKEFLQYDIDELKEYETVWDGKHTNGPEGPGQRYYVYMGTTVYGIQNLEYDPYTESMICCIYGVSGDIYPKYCTYMVDMTTLPEKGEISDIQSIGAITKFAPYGIYHEATGIWGAKFNKGSHGFASLGNGYYYIIESEINKEDVDRCDVYGLYKWIGGESLFERMSN